ncbi:hypothetical protein MAALD49_00560 [Marinobacter shengliensis]|nr:hypothetical protein MAALD49_00560 [Marinobacter shengliensis]
MPYVQGYAALVVFGDPGIDGQGNLAMFVGLAEGRSVCDHHKALHVIMYVAAQLNDARFVEYDRGGRAISVEFDIERLCG